MQTTQQFISTYFAADHDRLDALFNHYRRNKRDDTKRARPYFREFLKGLRRHIVWEEDVLFVFFEQASGIQSGPTEVMREEHRMIGAILDKIHEKVRNSDPNTDGEEEELIAILKLHNDKEENILYPAIDQYAGSETAAELFLKMEEVPDERFKSCCDSRK